MKTYLFLLAFFLGFVLNNSFAQTDKSKNQKPTATKENNSNKITCTFCTAGALTDKQAWKLFNDYANPELKLNGYGGIYQTVVVQYNGDIIATL